MKINYTEAELLEILEFTKEVAIDAGKKLIEFRKQVKELKVDYKEAQGVASKADTETEEFIINKIKNNFPDHDFLAEESYFKLSKSSRDYETLKEKSALWVIDPLDGTHNFLNGSDYFCISMAFLSYGRPKVGVIYRPVTKEFYFAIDGNGAWQISADTEYKKKKINIENNNKELKDSVMVTGFATEKGEPFDKEFELFKKMMFKARGIRRFGSAALDLCYVATGVWDGFWERELAPWDVAAAGLIMQEAGGKVTDYSGQTFNPFQDSIVAFREPLYSKAILNIQNT